MGVCIWVQQWGEYQPDHGTKSRRNVLTVGVTGGAEFTDAVCVRAVDQGDVWDGGGVGNGVHFDCVRHSP